MNPRRRALAALIAAAAAGTGARAQAARARTIGYLTGGATGARYLSGAMARRGWVEGRDVRYEVRTVARDGSGADEAATALVRAAPDVLVAQGQALVTALARATKSVPIVCGGISDPVGEGIARTLQRPGGNVTGLSFGLPEAAVLQVGTLKILAPGLERLVFVTTEKDPHRIAPAHEAAARGAGLSAEMVRIGSMADLERALRGFRPASDAAWIAEVPRDASAEAAAAAAIRARIPTHARGASQVRAGLLMSYWIVHPDPLARVAAIVEKVLRGESPAAIPFELPDQTDLVLNRATAAAIGVTFPPGLLLRATEVVG